MRLLISLVLAAFVAGDVNAAEAARSSSSGGVVTGPLWLAASTAKRILEVRIGSMTVRRYDVSVGSKKHPTPKGRFQVRRIVWNPSWVPPDEPWARDREKTPPGHPKNPMEVVKIFFQEPDYYIHGTDDEDSIGEAASHGCIRMSESDAFRLGRYLMDHAGATRSDAWYDKVLNGGRPAVVLLPHSIPMVIGR